MAAGARWLLCLALALLCPFSGAQAAGAARPALWLVQDGDTALYLFGTVHVLPKDTQWFDGVIKTAFDKADALYLETTTEQLTSPGLRWQIEHSGTLAKGLSLQDYLSEDAYSALKALSKQHSIPWETWQRYKPWLASFMVNCLLLDKREASFTNGADWILDQAAIKSGKERGYLERAVRVVATLGGLPNKEWATLLEQQLAASPATSKNDFHRLVAAWKSGNQAHIEQVIETSFQPLPAIEKALLFDRNRDWAITLTGRMRKPGTVFVAVGAGHMVGKDNLLAQLEQRGFKYKRLQ